MNEDPSTTEEIMKILGDPEKIVDLVEKKMYVYKRYEGLWRLSGC
jgi:hypothetical protein